MKTYLFAWNPKKWDWTHLEETIDQLEQIGRVSERWSCSSHKSIRPGDRAFLVKLGTNPKGIIGAGFVLTEPFLAKHWSSENKLVPRVMLDFEVLLNPTKDPILTLDILNQGKLNKQNWTPQSSGISIRDDVTDELEAVWL
jgi:5-methylcytosine-specific restriction protein A